VAPEVAHVTTPEVAHVTTPEIVNLHAKIDNLEKMIIELAKNQQPTTINNNTNYVNVQKFLK
jgi:hypothetical protein